MRVLRTLALACAAGLVAAAAMPALAQVDIIWQNAATGQTSYWTMNGATSTSAAVLLTDANWRVTASADFNGDGKSDLLWYNAATGQTYSTLMLDRRSYSNWVSEILLTHSNWQVNSDA